MNYGFEFSALMRGWMLLCLSLYLLEVVNLAWDNESRTLGLCWRQVAS